MMLGLFIQIALIFAALIGGLLVGQWQGYREGFRVGRVLEADKHYREREKKTKRKKSGKGAK